MADLLEVEALEHVRIWTVRRPDARNAINAEVAGALEQALDEVEAQRSVRAVILTGVGDTFISGADLKFLRSAAPEARLAQDARVLSLLRRIEALPLPVIAALNGAAIGGGTEVALACDLRVADTSASFTFKHAAMGVTPGWGGLGRLAASVGRGAAAKLLFTAQPVSAQEALRIGLVDEIAAPGALMQRALELADAISRNSPATLAALKQLLRSAYAGQLTLEEEQRAFHASAAHPDHAEALDAFFAKRPSIFAPRS